MSRAPEVYVLNTMGTNCNRETATAFEMAGATTTQVHVNQLVLGERSLHDCQILALPGGFSYGDDLGSGKVLALQLEHKLNDEIYDFVERKRGLVIGICNGFQVLVKAGLLPGGSLDDKQSVTLTHNSHGKFECRWIGLTGYDSNCAFTPQDSEPFELPIANGEGRLVTDRETLGSLAMNGNIALRYLHNPNGSVGDIAGLTDASGRILGMMPHPERFVNPWDHPNFHADRGIQPAGLPIFEAMVKQAQES